MTSSMLIQQSKWPPNRIIASLGFAMLLMVPPATAHQYADGFVERSMTITIRGDRAYGEYSIGLNATTAQSLLDEINALPTSESPTENKTGPATSKEAQPKVVSPKLNGSRESAEKGKPIKEPPHQNGLQEGVGEHLTDEKTIKQFEKLSKVWFSKHFLVSLDDKPVKLEKIVVSPLARHPYSMTVKFEFDLQAIKKSDLPNGSSKNPNSAPKKDSKPRLVLLKLQDDVFASSDGAIRYAMRAKGSTMLNRTNVAPVLARAKRHELAELSEQDRKVLRSIEAQVILSKAP